MQKCFITIVFALTIGLALSCTDFKELGLDLGGVSATPESLSFSSKGDTRNLSVRGGERWEISAKPAWLSVNSIQSNQYSWTMLLSAEANKDYDRSGSLTLKSKSSTATVSITQNGEKGQYVPVSSISVSPGAIELTEGDTYQLTAAFSPENASNQNVSWESSATSVATVSSSGLVTAVSEGTATIKVKSEEGNYTATSAVLVKKRVIRVTAVTLNTSTLSLTEGDTYQLSATVSPSNASNPNVRWTSSATSVASISSAGLVTAVSEGSATIMVITEDGDYTATCRVIVKKKVISVTGVSLNTTSITLTEGDTYQLTAAVSPLNATNKNVSWQSNATSVVVISPNGLITAKSEGSATITVTSEDGGYTATCRVTVNKKTIAVTGVSLNTTSITLTEGDTYQLTAAVSPLNATNKNVSWQSSVTSVATVSSSGLITAKSEGLTTITATTEDGGYMATCQVSVNKNAILVTGVSLNSNDVTLSQGEKYQLTATVSPSNATNKNVRWQSSATGVALVSSNGMITARAEGLAYITVTTEDGNYSASCGIYVSNEDSEARKAVLLRAINDVEMALESVNACDLSKNDSVRIIDAFAAFAEAREAFFVYDGTSAKPNLNYFYYRNGESVGFSKLSFNMLCTGAYGYNQYNQPFSANNSAFANIANQLFGSWLSTMISYTNPPWDMSDFQLYLHPSYGSPAFYYLYEPRYVNGKITTFYNIATGQEYFKPHNR